VNLDGVLCIAESPEVMKSFKNDFVITKFQRSTGCRYHMLLRGTSQITKIEFRCSRLKMRRIQVDRCRKVSIQLSMVGGHRASQRKGTHRLTDRSRANPNGPQKKFAWFCTPYERELVICSCFTGTNPFELQIHACLSSTFAPVLGTENNCDCNASGFRKLS